VLFGADTHVRAHTKLNGVLDVEILLSNRLSAILSLALAGKLADDLVLAYGGQQLMAFRRLSGIAPQQLPTREPDGPRLPAPPTQPTTPQWVVSNQ
jgi:hypothetical protein